MLCSVYGIQIYKETLAPQFWRNQISWEVMKQVDGISSHLESGGVAVGRINISPFEGFKKSEQADFVVPQAFEYFAASNLFVDYDAKLAVKILGTTIDIWVSSKPLHLALPVFIQILLEDHGCKFLHGAGFEVNGEGVLLSAFGGIGKTALVAQLSDLKVSAKLLGDDLVLIDEEGRLRPYAKPFCLYPYHRSLFPRFFSQKKKPILPFNFITNALMRANLQLSSRPMFHLDFLTAQARSVLDPARLSTNAVPLRKVYVVERSASQEADVSVNEMSADEAARFSANVIFHEWTDYLRFFIRQEEVRGRLISRRIDGFKDHFLKAFGASRVSCVKLKDQLSPEATSRVLREVVFEC